MNKAEFIKIWWAQNTDDTELYDAVWDIVLPQDVSTYSFFAATSINKNMSIDWGDGSPVELAYPYLGNGYCVLVEHSYPGPGNYRIKLKTSQTNTKAVIYLGEPYSWKQGTAGDNVLRPVSVLKIVQRLMGRSNGMDLNYGRFSYNCSNLVSVNFVDNFTLIPGSAFQGCTSLALTSLPAGVNSIGASAFRGCTSLALSSLPAGVNSIGASAFQGCTSLALTSLPAGVNSIGNYAFQGCTSLALTSLPSGVTVLPLGMCQLCVNNRIASLPPYITSIGDYVFQNNRLNTFDTIPASVRSIGNVAIATSASSITFLGTPSSIHAQALSKSNNPNILDIYVPWAEGEVANAPWGATNATIHYNHTV